MVPNLPVGGSVLDVQLGNAGTPPEGLTQLVLSYDYALLATELQGGDEVDSDASIDTHMVALLVRHHLGDGWAMDMRVPMGSLSSDAGDGTAITRSGGFGDVQLGARYELAQLWGPGGYAPSLTLRLALGLPTGEATPAETVLATGTGAFSATAELTYTQFATKWLAVIAPVSGRQPLSRNAEGSRVGSQLTAGLGAMVIPASGLQVSAGLTHVARDHGHNETNGELVNSGGHWLSAFVTVSAQVDERMSLWAGGRLPVLSDVNGQQLSSSFALNLGVAFSFGKEEGSHDHGDAHDHGDEHDHHDHAGGHDGDGHEHEDEGAHDDGHRHADHDHADGHGHGHGDGDGHGYGDGHGAGVEAPAAPPPAAADAQPAPKPARPRHRPDMRDVATGGESFSLASALVPGKVTVIDFWATWCAPCEEIDRDLRRLTREHAKLAVRRVEITDGDCAASEQHLGGSPVLPAIWIYGPAGTRVEDLRGATAEQIRQAVARALSTANTK
ncbi:MAG: thioredoxin domain-containing protein [Myxococcales bacterium]|nr:thioredoxin domain-containing protein [Myxococcales bacterium]